MKRLDEFQWRGNEIPTTFREFKAVLPQLVNALTETQKQAEQGLLEENTQKALLPVAPECQTQCG